MRIRAEVFRILCFIVVLAGTVFVGTLWIMTGVLWVDPLALGLVVLAGVWLAGDALLFLRYERRISLWRGPRPFLLPFFEGITLSELMWEAEDIEERIRDLERQAADCPHLTGFDVRHALRTMGRENTIEVITLYYGEGTGKPNLRVVK